jgi:preprotein translocase subunit SecE
LIVAVGVIIGGVVAYYYYENESLLLRVAGVLIALAIAAVIAYQSMQGQEFWRFLQSSRGELRKVIWPSRQETVQTTLTVFVFVLILGVFFWLLDMGLVSITRWLTGQGN